MFSPLFFSGFCFYFVENSQGLNHMKSALFLTSHFFDSFDDDGGGCAKWFRFARGHRRKFLPFLVRISLLGLVVDAFLLWLQSLFLLRFGQSLQIFRTPLLHRSRSCCTSQRRHWSPLLLWLCHRVFLRSVLAQIVFDMLASLPLVFLHRGSGHLWCKGSLISSGWWW